MAGNSFGEFFRITTFGESHGEAIGVVIDGCPAGLEFDFAFIQSELDRRRPGQSHLVTQRKESDTVKVLSGVFEGKTTGMPIAMVIQNEDARSKDYSHIADKYRPSHADYTYQEKFGHRDYRGGGRSSARETAARVAAGAVAKLLLKFHGISVQAFVSSVGNVQLEKNLNELDLSLTENTLVRCPDPPTASKMIHLIEAVRKAGNTIGGTVTCVIKDCPAGLGEPVFDRLHADMGKAVLSINACKGFEIGSGFQGATMLGSEHNDPFVAEGNRIKTLTNYSGGVQGGISNGMDIYFKAAFKPVATIVGPQKSVTTTGAETTVTGRGRHDPCVLPRAVPIVEAMASIVLADHLLRAKASRVHH
jgi:chorismate synthase